MSDELIEEMARSIFDRMGAPKKLSVSDFRKTFRKEFNSRKNLGNDLATYRRLFGEVIRELENLIKHPPKSSPPERHVHHRPRIDFKKLAANDRN